MCKQKLNWHSEELVKIRHTTCSSHLYLLLGRVDAKRSHRGSEFLRVYGAVAILVEERKRFPVLCVTSAHCVFVDLLND